MPQALPCEKRAILVPAFTHNEPDTVFPLKGVKDTNPVIWHTSDQGHGVPHRPPNRTCQKFFVFMKQKQNCREYAQPGQLYTWHALCVCQVTETSASRPLQGCKYISSHACSPTYLSGRDCCKAAHWLLDSPAFQSCFMSLLQNNLYFNIFLMSTSALICCREEKFPPAMFCNQKHTCTVQHLLSDLFHGYSPRPRFRQQLFSIDISPEYD